MCVVCIQAARFSMRTIDFARMKMACANQYIQMYFEWSQSPNSFFPLYSDIVEETTKPISHITTASFIHINDGLIQLPT